MSEEVWEFSPGAFMEIGPEICTECGQPKGPDCEAAEFYADPTNREVTGPGRKRHGRTRIEIVADYLGREVKVDYEADMAYIDVIPHDTVYRSDIKLEDRSLITDYDEDGNLLGVEIFLVHGAIRQVTVAALIRLLGATKE